MFVFFEFDAIKRLAGPTFLPEPFVNVNQKEDRPKTSVLGDGGRPVQIRSRMDSAKKGKTTNWVEFDCPECTAHNPWDDGFTVGDELFCGWCGVRLQVRRAGQEGDRYRLVID